MSFRNYILEKYEQEPSVFPKKVFIIRDSSGYESRSVLTNSNIYEALKNKGYMAVNPDKLSVHEQLILFNKATHIVSVHGAALANTLFCNENCKIIELIDYRVDSRFELFEEYKNYVFHNFWGRFLKSTALSYLIVDVTTGDWDKSVE